MRTIAVIVVWALGCATSPARTDRRPAEDLGPSSRVVPGARDELVLVQELIVNAPIERAWSAYTTSEGWRAWVAPVAEVDLRAGGSIRSHYTAGATLGQPGTIELKIVNFVPERLLTLKVEGSDAFPIFMRKDAENLFNVILFEALDATRTRITSYGLGYRDTTEYRELLEFFVGANEKTLIKLRTYLES